MEEKIEKGQQIGQLPKRYVLTGNEEFPFQEGRENGSITPNVLKSFISSGKGGYISYITEYNVSIHHPSSGIDSGNKYTLEGAIVQVPEDIRTVGLKVSFLNNSGLVETWEFAGGVFENIENWKSNEDKLTDIRDEAISKIKEVESDAISNFSSQRVTPDMLSESTKQFINASGGGTINNLADDEDLVSVDKGESLSVLKFADRAYNPDRFSGKGYKILRRNIIDGKNILTQEMINQPDTIYEIRYDFDLNGAQITIPENCILKFDGGSLSNGIINCNNTIIQADPYNIFTNVEVKGTHSSGANIEWFFRDKDEFYNNAFKDAITYFSTINFISGKEYIFDKSVIDCCHLINPYILNGNNCKFYDFSLAYNITKDDNMTPNSTSLLASLGTSIRDISFYRKNHYEHLQYPALIVSHKIEVKNCKFAGYNYCVGLTPVYIDSLLFESISQYDCKNLLACCDYNGNVIEDRTFYGDWFYFSNSDFGPDENIVYGGLKSTVSILFNNCLHGIVALPEIQRYVVEISTILYSHCHFENRQPCVKFINPDDEGKQASHRITFVSSFLYSDSVPRIQGINYIDCHINIGNNNNFGIDVQKYLNGTYIIGDARATPLFVDTNKDINTDKAPSFSSITSTYVYDVSAYKGDFTYPEDKEECVAYAMSSSPDRLVWGNYETTEPLKFTDYITIHKGNIMSIEMYYKNDNIGCINSYILFFKKDKATGQVYKTYIRVTKELLNSVHGVNNLRLEIPYIGSIGSKWEEFNDELLYKPHIRIKGTFAQKPVSNQGIQQGFSYFCTDKQTIEGSRNGIMIYYAGNDNWIDALGRYIY